MNSGDVLSSGKRFRRDGESDPSEVHVSMVWGKGRGWYFLSDPDAPEFDFRLPPTLIITVNFK